MDSYEVERLIESAVRDVRSALEHEIYMLERRLDDANGNISRLEDQVARGFETVGELTELVRELGQVVGTHTRAFQTMGQIAQEFTQ